jgi:hypothetical protein
VCPYQPFYQLFWYAVYIYLICACTCLIFNLLFCKYVRPTTLCGKNAFYYMYNLFLMSSIIQDFYYLDIQSDII